jgi:hypothetical protein
MTRLTQFTVALALAGTAAACSGSSSDTSSVLAPTATGTVSTETFTGSVLPPVAGVAQVDVHNFTITVGGGSLNVTLVSAGPPSTITMGLGVGNPSSTGTCSFLTNGAISTVAGSTAQLTGTNFSAGTYCVAVFDVGNVLQPVTYTVTVAHT